MATYLVTGSARGIGLALCQQLQERGDTAIAVCRQSSPELDSLGIRVETGIDITSDQTLKELVQRLQGISLDVLLNNAGILEEDSLDHLDFDSIQRQFEVNALGTLRVTQALLPFLSQGSKIAIVTSRMGSLEDNSSGGYYGYRMSKVAVSMAGKSLAIDLKPRQIAVAIVHPGLVQTQMTDFTGISPREAAHGIIQRIDNLTLDNSGTFWHANGEVLPW
ncbi:SDR family oxidoreductase [Laspinema olomoucense]|uniref:SDR family oxidoreductase n=1 Tax=Laspinema olomoucense D3b TaxID=2953688 RepID=A0ABT2N7I0_9CYAN|nr:MULTISPECIES: SDR family oxidoreductase [unclassified Laspinema]MCT7973284.1 SDR family oxidoreductase [Laspinema sp. D3d]MCT7977330.1 SDR family oxidoreductase [Laspinema sp. D3b]MCT7990795.1 SDR family oxidoreductase [Laspinema sp. D3a]